jgi:hypothetical protein
MRLLEPYKAYNFRDKDPVIDELRTMVTDEYGRLDGKALKDIELSGGPRVNTMRGWFFKDTRRPQSAGVESAGRAMGWYRPWQKMPPALAKVAKAGKLNKAKRNGHGGAR